MIKNRDRADTVVLAATIKGISHALVIPLNIMLITMYLTGSLWSFASPLVYIGFASWFYLHSKDKDISKMVFFNTLLSMLTLALIYVLLVFS